MANPILEPEIRELLASQDYDTLRGLVESTHPETMADLLAALEPEEIWQVLSRLPSETSADIFTHLEDDIQVAVVAPLGRGELAELVTHMPADERVDLLKNIPEEKQHTLLPALARAEREDIRRLASYEEGTAGSVMTSDYATLAPEMTAREAIDRLRVAAPDKETIYYAYVVDEHRKLLGYVSLRDLILARPGDRIDELMERDAVYVEVNADQEEAARQISKFDLLALPVVDPSGALCGIITHDDAMDVLTQENTEDLEKIMAIGGTHEAADYMRTPALAHFRRRAGWVFALAILGLVSGAIVEGFEEMLTAYTILVVFMPMLVDTGGNTGSQSATLVVRALALGELTPRDTARVLFKEFKVSIMLALMLAIICFGRVWFFSPEAEMAISVHVVAIAIAVALGIQVISATLIGAILPLGASALKLDPAVVASPALTTAVDITGLIIYFNVVRLFLPL